MEDREISREEAIKRLEGGAPFSEIYEPLWEAALALARKALKTEPVVWTPITARPMDEEELKRAEELGFILENDEAWIYTSQLPDDGQEVLVCGRNGRVWIDTFYNDSDYGCYFEDNGDMDGIMAWMPLPKPYREKEKEDERA